MAGYVATLKKDIARWEASGFVDGATANVLRRDAETFPRGGVSFGQILSVLAAALIGAAILLIIAANWEAFPRIARVVMIFLLILGGYVGGAMLKARGNIGFGEALWLLAAISFGAGIALVAQMYHVSGDETQAILTWCAGTALAALVLRSGPLTAGSVLLAGGWMMFITSEATWLGYPPTLFLAIVAVIWAISLWTESVAARHLILLSLMLYAGLHYLASQTLLAPTTVTVLSILLFAAWAFMGDEVERFAKLGEGGVPVQALLGFNAGMSPIQFEYQDSPQFIFIAIVIFAGVVGALVIGGRESRMLRWLAYAAFSFELIYVYVVLLVSMIGTAGFFLTAGLVVGLLAWFISRVEKRLAAPPPSAAAGQGAAA